MQARAHQEKWPPALASSLAFRLYLAERDVFVRRAARDVFHLRRRQRRGEVVTYYVTKMQVDAAGFARALRAGRLAARAMWRRTRDPGLRGQNEAILEADRLRLADWQGWLRRTGREPQIIFAATPVCGVWQLRFWVHNFAPAAQQVAVEEQQADGAWRELAARHTIEFRATAARPRTKIRREFTVPVESAESRLRVVVRGCGEVAISQIQLTDGVEVRSSDGCPRRLVLGRPAPVHGLPAMEGNPEGAESILRFRRRTDRA